MPRKLVHALLIAAIAASSGLPAEATTHSATKYYATWEGFGTGGSEDPAGVGIITFHVPAGAKTAKILIHDLAFPRTFAWWDVSTPNSDVRANGDLCRATTIDLPADADFIDILVQPVAPVGPLAGLQAQNCSNSGSSAGSIKVVFAS